mmetsp:Transcript_3916/g.6145  ORF Transcript_3916/g.6145 Transcript_3916/m.6145 type:complete len:628 (+) Transcript_3916:16-1899(+)
MSITSTRPVIISGGGIAGLTLSAALYKCHIPHIIIEQSPPVDTRIYTDSNRRKPIGGGIGLWGPALKALKQLGIESKLIGCTLSCAGYRSYKQLLSDEWLVRPSNNKHIRHTSCLCLRRASLHDALSAGINEENIRMGCKVVSFRETFQGVVVTLDDGTEIEGSLLVGADGVHSTIRKLLFPTIQTKPCGYYYWQGVGQSDVYLDHTTDEFPAYEAWHPGRRFGVVPLPAGEFFWFICSDKALPDDVKSIQAVKQNLSDLIKPFGPHALSLLDSTHEDGIYQADLQEVPVMPSWSSGRVVIIGDAAHAMAPNLAQGACLSIEDAFELAHRLHEACKLEQDVRDISTLSTADICTALLSFERSRKFRTRSVQTLVPLVHTMGAMGTPYNTIRDVLFGMFPSKLKTVVFDWTHRAALGWSYTPPNLGQGLYHRLLGEEFMQRNGAISDFHRWDVDRKCSGTVTLTRGTSILSVIISTLMGMSENISNGRVLLNVTTDREGAEYWCRVFSDEYKSFSFNTRQHICEESMVETFGPLQFHFDIDTCYNSFTATLRNLYFGIPNTIFLIPLPQILHPVVVGSTSSFNKCDGWDFDVEVRGWDFVVDIRGPKIFESIIGLIVKYEGRITDIGT